MDRREYRAYLRSPPWRALVARVHVRAGGRCEGALPGYQWPKRSSRCDRAGEHVHHLTYARIGHERLEDLQLLCLRCHVAAHLAGWSCDLCGDHPVYTELDALDLADEYVQQAAEEPHWTAFDLMEAEASRRCWGCRDRCC